MIAASDLARQKLGQQSATPEGAPEEGSGTYDLTCDKIGCSERLRPLDLQFLRSLQSDLRTNRGP
jgi:hypothetical protein